MPKWDNVNVEALSEKEYRERIEKQLFLPEVQVTEIEKTATTITMRLSAVLQGDDDRIVTFWTRRATTIAGLASETLRARAQGRVMSRTETGLTGGTTYYIEVVVNITGVAGTSASLIIRVTTPNS